MTRTSVVTGSASGIGAATREWLERRGDRVIGVDLHDAEVVADLATDEGRRAIVDQVKRLAGGRLDAVVACAGLFSGADPAAIVRVNHFGAVATLTGLRPLLVAGNDPRAAVVASVALLYETNGRLTDACLSFDEEAALAAATDTGDAAYSSTKRAIARWVRRAAPTAEWAGAGIPLNAVAPGVIRTPMSQPLRDDPERMAELDRRLPHPLRRVGEPEHIASLLAWLVSPENAFTTGQVIFADAGFEALRRGDELPRVSVA